MMNLIIDQIFPYLYAIEIKYILQKNIYIQMFFNSDFIHNSQMLFDIDLCSF